MKKLFLVFITALLIFAEGNIAFSQNVSVGPVAPAVYVSLGAAFAAVNAGTHGANPVVKVLLSYNEPGPASLFGAGFATCSITTSGANTVTAIGGGFNDAIIILDGASNVTIDGSAGTGLPKLKLVNMAATTGGGAVRVSNGGSNNVISYIEFNGVGIGNTNGGRAINIAQSTGAGCNNNIIEHCLIDGCRRGVQTFGSSGISTNDGTIIRNNVIRNVSAIAVFVGSDVFDCTVSGNDISHTVPITPAATGFVGIQIQGIGTINIVKNQIHNINSDVAAAGDIFGLIAIPIIPVTPIPGPTTLNVINNSIILNDLNSTSANVYGMNPSNIATSVDYIANILNNTIRIGGIANASVAATSVCILSDNAIAGSETRIYNNVCINTRSGGDGTGVHTGNWIVEAPGSLITDADYNLSVATDPIDGWNGVYNKVGAATTNYLYENIDQYKDSTCEVGGPGIEQHSMYRDIPFTGANTYKLGLIGGDMAGKPLALVPNDIDGDPRNANFPYKGCDEKATALRVLDLGGCLEGYIPGADGQIKVVLSTACSDKDSCTADLIGSPTLQSKLTFGDAVPNGGYTLNITSINHLETYSAAAVAFGGPLVSYNFKPAVTTAFGNNLTTGAAPHCFFAGDENQDGFVDLTDLSNVFNSASAFTVGCRLAADMNGDDFVDLTDLSSTFNNASLFVQVASPCPEPNISNYSNTLSMKSKTIINSELNKLLQQ